MLVITKLAAEDLSILKSSNVPIPTSALVRFALVMVAVVIPASVAVTAPTNLVAVMIPLVFALNDADSVDAKETFAVPSNGITEDSKSPVIEKSLEVSSFVVDAEI